jgi:xanthine dehydrogenase accessory factor
MQPQRARAWLKTLARESGLPEECRFHDLRHMWVSLLRAAGVSDEDLRRINSPCGLDIGARTPAETAIAVLGEILALRSGRRGGRLAEASGPIHPRAAEVA